MERTRGTSVESTHYAAAAIVNAQGELLAWLGNPRLKTFLRSSAKPFQAFPLIEENGARHFNLTPREIAQICASHAGTDMHVETVRGIQAKIGVDESFLQCGTHPPMDKDTAERLLIAGEKPTPLRHNCSGKHTGMLALAKMRGNSLQNYLAREHPVQQTILATFGEMCRIPTEKIAIGTDGCSAPNFSVPLYNAALGFARLCDPRELPEKRANACRVITSAMTAHPEMVSGFGRFDTRLMQVGRGKFVVKMGAEGYQAIGVRPDSTESSAKGIGIVLKISDGDPTASVRAAVTLEILRQLELLGQSELDELSEFGPVTPIFNWRKIKVGESRPVFSLKKT